MSSIFHEHHISPPLGIVYLCASLRKNIPIRTVSRKSHPNTFTKNRLTKSPYDDRIHFAVWVLTQNLKIYARVAELVDAHV